MNAVLPVAIALQDQIERIGSYCGFAAVIGLGVMALLYFTQAREVKRLREWAGRAPERDLELAQRVQSDAQKRVVAQPVPAAGAGGPSAGPQTAAAQADAARQPAAAPATQKPQTSGAPATSPAVGPPGQLARPGTPAAQPASAKPASGAPAPGAPGLGSPPAGTPAPDAPAPGPPVPPSAATASAVAAARRAATAGRSPAGSNGSGAQDTHESAAARPSALPDLPARAARPAPAAAQGDRGTPPRRHTGLIAGVAAGVLAIGVLLVVLLSGGGSDTPAAEQQAGNAPPAASSPQQPAQPTVDRGATKVFVLNGTVQTGLAGSVASTIEKHGFTLPNKDDNPVQNLTTTSVYYAAGAEPAARIIAKIVHVGSAAVQVMDADNAAKVPAETDVLVITGSDIAAAG